MNLYKRCIAKPYSFLVVDTTLASDNHSRFRKNLLDSVQISTHNTAQSFGQFG